MAMFPAVVFVRLRTTGELVLPVVGVPGRIDLGDPWPVRAGVRRRRRRRAGRSAPSSYLLVFRPLRDAPPVTRLVASVGLTIVLQGAAVAQVGTATERAEAVLPDDLLDVGDSILPTDRLWLLGVVVADRVGVSPRCTASPASGWPRAPRPRTPRAPS